MKKLLSMLLFVTSPAYAQYYDNTQAQSDNAYTQQVQQQEYQQQVQSQMQAQQEQINQQQQQLDQQDRGGNPNNPFGFNYVSEPQRY